MENSGPPIPLRSPVKRTGKAGASAAKAKSVDPAGGTTRETRRPKNTSNHPLPWTWRAGWLLWLLLAGILSRALHFVRHGAA